jgi:hypothetical protein
VLLKRKPTSTRNALRCNPAEGSSRVLFLSCTFVVLPSRFLYDLLGSAPHAEVNHHPTFGPAAYRRLYTSKAVYIEVFVEVLEPHYLAWKRLAVILWPEELALLEEDSLVEDDTPYPPISRDGAFRRK